MDLKLSEEQRKTLVEMASQDDADKIINYLENYGMPISNEQRAHDLAIAIISNLDLAPQDMCQYYLKYYDEALTAITADN